MNILAIETSCDETSAAVVADGERVLGQVTASQMEIHRQFGGVVPEVASRRHVEAITRVVDTALAQAGLGFADLGAIAVTMGPGLLGALLVGVTAAKAYSLATGLPLVGVHHIAGHVAAALLEEPDRPPVRPPFLCLVASGGHTELYEVDASFAFKRLGGTRDDAAGEAYDKVARLIGLAYPGGPEVDRLARLGDPGRFSFPRGLLDDPSLDFSFSGMKTAVLVALDKLKRQGQAVPVEDVCASFQAAVIEVLVEKTRRAASMTGHRTVVVAGGVAANRGLRAAMQAMAAEEGLEVHFPSPALCTDNAAMIGAAAYLRAREGRFDTLELGAYADLTLEEWQSGRYPMD